MPLIGEHLEAAPYMGVLFILLTIACGLLAALVLWRDAPATYLAAAVLCATAIAAYAATRLVPFPLLEDDVADWLEPLGVMAVLSELGVVVVAVAALTRSAPPR